MTVAAGSLCAGTVKPALLLLRHLAVAEVGPVPPSEELAVAPDEALGLGQGLHVEPLGRPLSLLPVIGVAPKEKVQRALASARLSTAKAELQASGQVNPLLKIQRSDVRMDADPDLEGRGVAVEQQVEERGVGHADSGSGFA